MYIVHSFRINFLMGLNRVKIYKQKKPIQNIARAGLAIIGSVTVRENPVEFINGGTAVISFRSHLSPPKSRQRPRYSGLRSSRFAKTNGFSYETISPCSSPLASLYTNTHIHTWIQCNILRPTGIV